MISLYWPAWWMIFCPPFESKLVPIVFSCHFSSYQIRSCVNKWTVPKSCPFVEKAGKPQNWSVMGCAGLTPWSAGSSSLVSEPSTAVPSTAARPSLPGRGRLPRLAGSPSALADKGRPGRPPIPISFALPSPAPPGRRTRRQIRRCH